MNRAAGKSSDTSSAKRGAEIVRVEFSPTSEGITHRPASIGRLIGLIFTLAIAGLLFSTRAAITDSMVPVTSLSALNAGDSVAWSQLGSDGTMLSSSFDANSIGSIAVTGALAASGSLVSVVCPASQCSWGSPGSGGFSAADTVIWTSDTGNGGTGPLTLAFGAPVKGVGAFIQADGPSKFTAQIQAFNGGTMLKSFTAQQRQLAASAGVPRRARQHRREYHLSGLQPHRLNGHVNRFRDRYTIHQLHWRWRSDAGGDSLDGWFVAD